MLPINPVPIHSRHANPLINIHCNPDPYIIRHEGKYYCYSSGYYGVNVLQSEDLEAFEHMGFALASEEWRSYWAPAVFFYNNVFYMYYSSLPKGENDDHRHYLQVAVSDHPLGPFTYQKTLYQEFSIDPHVVQKDGKLYLFYSANDWSGGENGRIGTVVLLDRLLDPLTAQGRPRIVVAPSIDQEIFARNRFGDGKDWHTIEGAFYFEQDGTGYLLYSGNAYTHADYFVSYAVCDAALPLEKAVFRKYPDADIHTPLLGRDAYFMGCGHNSIIRGPRGELLIVYHGRPRTGHITPTELDDGRRLCISELTIDGKKLALRMKGGIREIV